MKIGVLALQGSFLEHVAILKRLGVQAVEVRLPRDLRSLAGLIIPGGESTTIGKLAVMYNLMEPMREFAKNKAVWGTCAGMIFMAREIHRDQPLLNIMDIVVERNAFGRQVDSFESELYVDVLNNGDKQPFPAIFIRAPKLVSARGTARVIARLTDATAVAALQDKLLVTSFHPELSGDDRFHRFFLDLADKQPS